MAAHRIQLKGPWQYRPICWDNAPNQADRVVNDLVSGKLPEAGTVKFPVIWHEFLDEFRGRLELRRPFNRPTNLSERDRIELVLEGIGGIEEVQLNTVSVGQIPASVDQARFDVTRHLRLHNDLRLVVCRPFSSADPCGVWGTVALEIYEV